MDLADLQRENLSIPKACKLLDVSRRTIYNWIEANKIQYFRTAGGSIRIYVDSLGTKDAIQRPTI